MILTASPQGDAVTFHDLYREQWDAAQSYAFQKHEAWNLIWDFFDIDSAMAEAVVFPEMVRYSLLQDRMETAAVKGTYVSRGTRGFNFSIGRFQMKPSFVEDLEKRWMRSPYPQIYDAYFDTDDTQFARRARIERLSDEHWQCVYLAMFIKLMYLDYGSTDSRGDLTQEGIDMLPVEEQLQILSTAYNRGCKWVNAGGGNLDEIRRYIGIPYFHTAFVPVSGTKRYVYSDISLEYYSVISM